MYSYICQHRSTRPLTVYIFILRLSARNFLGFCRCWNLPIVFSNIVFSKHLGLLAKNWGLRSILEGPPFNFFVRRFPKEAPKLSANFLLSFPSELAYLFRPISLGVSTLVSRLSDHLAAWLVELLWDISLQLGLRVRSKVSFWQRVYKSFGGTASLLHTTPREVCTLPSVLLVSWQRRFRWDASLL